MALAGVMPRIGTTTQAIQLAMYLKNTGYRVCYVEMNMSGYLEEMHRLYRGVKKRDNGYFEYHRLHLYTREGLKEAVKENYSFIVKDYGNIEDHQFEEISFSEQTIRLLVCGIKANEISNTETALKRFGEECDGFLFNFVSLEDRRWIRKMMEKKAKRTFFSGFTPDPFVYSLSSAAVYQSILMGKRNDTGRGSNVI